MHRSVLKNEDYIKFAADNTVEVISVSGVAKAKESGHEKAGTYEVEIAGETVEYLLEWPGMTVDQLEALRASKAASYNDTGGIPFTCIVDPHTLEKLESWSGAQQAKTLMEAVETHRKALEEAHGEGVSRKDLRKVDKSWTKALKYVGKKDYAKAVKEMDKIAKKAEDWHEEVVAGIAAKRQEVIDMATAALDEIEAMDDKREAKKLFGKFRSKLKGTGLEERGKALWETLNAR